LRPHQRFRHTKFWSIRRPIDRIVDVGWDAGSAPRPLVQPRHATAKGWLLGAWKEESDLYGVKIPHDDLRRATIITGRLGPEVQLAVPPVRTRNPARSGTLGKEAQRKRLLDQCAGQTGIIEQIRCFFGDHLVECES